MPILVSRHGICIPNKHKGPNGQTQDPGLESCVYSMTGYKKKIVAFLVTVAVGSGMLVVYRGQSGTFGPESEPSNAGFRSVHAGGASKFIAGSLFASDPNFSKGPGNSSGSKDLFFKMMLSILLVVVLGAAAIYISRKLLPRITNLPGKEIRIAETVHLGPRKTVHLLKIGNQWLLIGSTSESITKLADVTDALADLSAQERDAVRV